MKKFLSLLLSLAMLLSVAALADETHGNYSDEMKIPLRGGSQPGRRRGQR